MKLSPKIETGRVRNGHYGSDVGDDFGAFFWQQYTRLSNGSGIRLSGGDELHISPGKGLVSLLQLMNEYKLGDLSRMLNGILAADRDLASAEAMGTEKAHAEYCHNLAIAVEGLMICCENCDADPSLIQQMRTLTKELQDDKADTRCPVLHARLQTIIQCVQHNLDSRTFMFVPKEDASYWHNLQLFGKEFYLVFPPAAIFEVGEIGSCFAASRSIACVFHCMRVAEYGLRILARKVRVKLTDKGKPIQIEYATWDKVIQGIRNRIIDIRKRPVGPKKEKDLQFYAAAADHCEYMKDIWRNEIAHARHRFYTREETLGVISRVRLFAGLITEHEKPKDPKKQIAASERSIRKLQQSYGGIIKGSPQQDQGTTGSGENVEGSETKA